MLSNPAWTEDVGPEGDQKSSKLWQINQIRRWWSTKDVNHIKTAQSICHRVKYKQKTRYQKWWCSLVDDIVNTDILSPQQH